MTVNESPDFFDETSKCPLHVMQCGKLSQSKRSEQEESNSRLEDVVKQDACRLQVWSAYERRRDLLSSHLESEEGASHLLDRRRRHVVVVATFRHPSRLVHDISHRHATAVRRRCRLMRGDRLRRFNMFRSGHG